MKDTTYYRTKEPLQRGWNSVCRFVPDGWMNTMDECIQQECNKNS
jgi:hypothetical protein